ncbi:MAG TPA: hypothetical protein VF868_06905 [Bacteroidia bacterium]
MSGGKAILHSSKMALNKTKSRIFEMSLDALMMDEEFISGTYCEFDRVHFEVKKQILLCKMLQQNLTKNKIGTITHILNQVIRKAKEYEIFPPLVEALIFKKFILGGLGDSIGFEKATKEIDFYSKCNEALNTAMHIYHQFILDATTIKVNSKKELYNNLVFSIKKIEAYYAETKSQQVNYYLHIMKFALSEQKKDYPNAVKECKLLIKLMERHPSVYRKKRVGFAYDNLSHYSVFVGDLKSAEKYVLKARTYFTPNSLDIIICYEVEFFVSFYTNRNERSEELIDHLLTYPTEVCGLFRKAKYTFFKALLLFKTKNFKQSLLIVSKPLEVERDKYEWNIILRILNVQLLIELNKLTDASRTLEALRKYVERNKADKKIKERDRLILKCLLEMEKNNFEYDPGNKVLSKMHKQLSVKNTHVSWEYFTPELIPFHDWLSRKSDTGKSGL